MIECALAFMTVSVLHSHYSERFLDAYVCFAVRILRIVSRICTLQIYLICYVDKSFVSIQLNYRLSFSSCFFRFCFDFYTWLI